MRFGKDVLLELREIKLIYHVEPLLLIGADVLCGGREGWTYRAMGVGSARKGIIIFANGKRTVSLPLVNAPVLGRPRYVSMACTLTTPAPAAAQPAAGQSPAGSTNRVAFL